MKSVLVLAGLVDRDLAAGLIAEVLAGGLLADLSDWLALSVQVEHAFLHLHGWRVAVELFLVAAFLGESPI